MHQRDLVIQGLIVEDGHWMVTEDAEHVAARSSHWPQCFSLALTCRTLTDKNRQPLPSLVHVPGDPKLESLYSTVLALRKKITLESLAAGAELDGKLGNLTTARSAL